MHVINYVSEIMIALLFQFQESSYVSDFVYPVIYYFEQTKLVLWSDF